MCRAVFSLIALTFSDDPAAAGGYKYTSTLSDAFDDPLSLPRRGGPHNGNPPASSSFSDLDAFPRGNAANDDTDILHDANRTSALCYCCERYPALIHTIAEHHGIQFANTNDNPIRYTFA